MTPRVYSDPFPHLVLDGFATPDELRAASASWPAPDWPGWVRYDDRFSQGKRASDLLTPLPVECSALLARMASLPIGLWLGTPSAVPDLALWGGGLHEMVAGAKLARHLDADVHVRLGLLRAWSAALYVHERWSPADGGALLLYDVLGNPRRYVPPAPGSLVAFDCRSGWHGVEPLLAGAPPRRSLALFGYEPRPGKGDRPRAEFRPCPSDV